MLEVCAIDHVSEQVLKVECALYSSYWLRAVVPKSQLKGNGILVVSIHNVGVVVTFIHESNSKSALQSVDRIVVPLLYLSGERCGFLSLSLLVSIIGFLVANELANGFSSNIVLAVVGPRFDFIKRRLILVAQTALVHLHGGLVESFGGDLSALDARASRKKRQ